MELGPRVLRRDDVLVDPDMITEAFPGGEGGPTSYTGIEYNASFFSCEISQEIKPVLQLLMVGLHSLELPHDEVI